MRKDRWAQAIMWRMTAWGFAGGAGAGFLYGVLVAVAGNMTLACIAGVVGFLVGGSVGGPLGLLNGLMLVGMTHLARRSEMRPSLYQLLACGMSALLTGTVALLGLLRFFSVTWDLWAAWWLDLFVPALIAAAVAVVATVKVTRWVGDTTAFSSRVE